MAEFSDFTKLVLARMESNPEEFCTLHMTGYSRWQGLTRGLEALARGDTHAKDFGVLWPLTDEERAALLESYRKLYLNELHRDMLKNIVSGADKPQIDPNTYTYSNGNDINPIKGSVLRASTTNTLLSSPQITAQVQGILEKEFDRAYAKAEGTKVQRFTINPAQVAVAKKMGISPAEYWAELQKIKYETPDND
jgi:hypothetical protein